VNYNPQGHKELDTTEELTLAYTGSNSAHRNTIHTRTTEPCSTSPRLTDSVTPSCLHTPGGERCSEVGTGRHLWPSLQPGTQLVLKERVDTKSRCRKEEQRGISGQSSLLAFVRKEYKTLPSGAVLIQCLSVVTSLHREEHPLAFIFLNEIFTLYWSGVIYDAALFSGKVIQLYVHIHPFFPFLKMRFCW